MNAGADAKSGAVQYGAGMGTRSGNGHHIWENTQSWFCCMFYIMNPQPVPGWSALSLLRWRKVFILLGVSSIPDHAMQQDLRAFRHHWEKINPPFWKRFLHFCFCALWGHWSRYWGVCSALAAREEFTRGANSPFHWRSRGNGSGRQAAARCQRPHGSLPGVASGWEQPLCV